MAVLVLLASIDDFFNVFLFVKDSVRRGKMERLKERSRMHNNIINRYSCILQESKASSHQTSSNLIHLNMRREVIQA